MTQLARGVTSVMGIGGTMTTIASMARKRDLTALWDLDPLAAPPKAVQEQIKGPGGAEPHAEVQEVLDDSYEQRCILELQLTYAMRRHDVERVRAISRELRTWEDVRRQQASNRAKAKGELRVGDHCFVLAKLVEWEWYQARLLAVRSREPALKIEYVANLDGDTSSLALPQPRINHVPIEHVRLDAPENAAAPIVPPAVPCVMLIEPSIIAEAP